MQNNFFKNLTGWAMAVTVLAAGLSSCEKDKDGTPEVAVGNMASGSIDPGEAGGGALITLTGSGIGQIRSIMFEKNNVPAAFQPTLNTESYLIFHVPDTAFGGPQNIVFTNTDGKTLTVPFTVLAFASVASVSNYNFTTDTEITLTGNNLDDVTKVNFTGTTGNITIVSKSRKTLVIKMPATDIARSTLDITNSTGKTVTTQEFVNLDKALKIFTDGYGADFGDNSWGDGATISSTEFKSGTKSLTKTYAKGNWHVFGFANWWPGVASDPSYKYFSFWIKGGSADQTLYITGDKKAGGGFGNSDRSSPVNVPANVWTYFKFALSDLKLWQNGATFNQIGFWIPGPENADEKFHLDDVIITK
ncbi:hypothetical protein LZZ85_08880 [Terrimonas sp. NA20]|uniref:Cell shape determination protein CcmA n=1 Tax=Terrimonas ginsenosidimutans TaxID=2908004 RepID=A0ABS9KPY4_9BACT|nr:hypothetical protein [Terrimonas ginsenosidimutans]MCG2614392.1 hypothetical protein [Terrimonas ginsenosidimutans]